MKICLIGASFETPNLGVSALADSAIYGILLANPNVELYILDYAYKRKEYKYSIEGKDKTIPLVNIRYSKNLFSPNNIAFLICCAILNRFTGGILKCLFKKNRIYRMLHNTDTFVSVTAGDSFSDIYGKRSFLYVGLPIFLVSHFKKKLVFLPQTYGPFDAGVSRLWARFLLNKAEKIFARDYKSIPVVKKLIPQKYQSIAFCYDVAFGLPSEMPGVSLVQETKNKKPFVGVNISGLLYMGGYTRKNMFGLKMDYKNLVKDTVCNLLDMGTNVILLPHVVGSESIENDTDACKDVYAQFSPADRESMFVVEENLTQREIKGVISRCCFFIGSRMHSCIAALSQCIPAVGIAYSRKFIGLYETVGCQELVLDPRKMSEPELLGSLDRLYRQKEEIKTRLKDRREQVTETLAAMFRYTTGMASERLSCESKIGIEEA